ncbi:MAG: hypothetical protein Q4G10_01785 [Bacteroidia bacterium]|nr:hypothetical protein [Bacteroidia bacterium]
MEEIKKLYPLRFLPIGETFAWGGNALAEKYDKKFVESDDQGNEKRLEKGVNVAESHEIADLGYRDSQVRDGWLAGNTISEIMDMYLDRVVGENVFEYYGRQFPLGVKFIDARERMPLVVSPDDETADQRYDFLGKVKMWYVVDATPASRIFLGFKKDTAVQDFYEGCGNGSVENLLNIITPVNGDVFVIEPGTVHAAQGVTLLEVSEASPLDFCLSGWGKEVPEDEFDANLSLVEALDFIDYKAYKPASQTDGKLVQRREMTVTRLDLKDPVHIIGEEAGSFAVYACVAGEASIQVADEDKQMENYTLPAGETVLVPSDVDDFYLVPRQSGTILIEAMVDRLEEEDKYIDPEAEPVLPGENEEFKFNSVYGRFSKN